MVRKVVVFGVGDFARTAGIYLAQDSPYEVTAFTAHQRFIEAPDLLGKPVVPFEQVQERFPPDSHAMFVAVGFSRVNAARAEICAACKKKGYELISYVNSKAMQWGQVDIGENCFVLEGAVLQPFTHLGNDVVLWSGSIVCHDSRIGDHCFIAAHATISGNVTVGPYCFIGAGAIIRDSLTLGQGCVIGAGALVLKDTPAHSVHLGVAASRSQLSADQLRSF